MVEVSPAAVVDVDAAAVVELVVSAADVVELEVSAADVVELEVSAADVVSADDVVDEDSSSVVEVASSVVEVASSVVEGEPGMLGVVVAGGPLLGVVWGLVDGVVDTSVGVV